MDTAAAEGRQVNQACYTLARADLWLAEAARKVGGTVATVEMSRLKFDMAQANFARSGLAGSIQQVEGDAGGVLRATGEGAYDLVFLDSERSEYVG